jgi:hypothetical protein
MGALLLFAQDIRLRHPLRELRRERSCPARETSRFDSSWRDFIIRTPGFGAFLQPLRLAADTVSCQGRARKTEGPAVVRNE